MQRLDRVEDRVEDHALTPAADAVGPRVDTDVFDCVSFHVWHRLDMIETAFVRAGARAELQALDMLNATTR